MPELSHRRRMLVLAICCMSLLIVSLDVTILNVALPAMQKDLDASLRACSGRSTRTPWSSPALLMLAGSTADRIGRRRVFMAGLVVFTIGSVALLARAQPRIADRLPHDPGGRRLDAQPGRDVDHHQHLHRPARAGPRDRGLGRVVGISMAAGPLVGGLLVDSVGWRSIFWINLPVGLAALLLTLRYVPESRAPKARRPDPVGQFLVIALLGSLTYAIIEAPSSAVGQTLAFGGVALAALVALLWYEPRRDEPLIDLRFFRSAPFSGATVVAVSAFAALGGFLFLSTLYLQNVRGLTPSTRACGCCRWRS
jgi:MFS family permease